MTSLDSIITYSINDPLEVKSLKLCIMWEDIAKKELPGYRIQKLKKGDPRKCILFKYCYKLARETAGLISDEDYKLYILAQVQVLKTIKDEKDVHALVTPQCLTGGQAWKRWKLWKSKYDEILKKQQKPQQKPESVAIPTTVRIDLEKTREFLVDKFQGTPTFEQFKRAFKESFVVKWAMLGKLSPYYVVLSPYIKKVLDNKEVSDYFTKDFTIYKSSLTEELKIYFRKLFEYEY